MPVPGEGLLFDSLHLDRLFAVLEPATMVVAAVSGGPDSMALMHLLARWRERGSRPPILVATVDHGLRPESAGEAALVAEEAARAGLPHQVLAWTGSKPAHGLQAAARRARYRLLVDLAQREGASHLVTAHTREDQAETLLMRLSRGSGPAGLAGMRTLADREGLCHARPLLETPRARLRELCTAHGWRFVDDPSNQDERYARVRWRRLMPLLETEGITAERLARLAGRLARADEALSAVARRTYEQARLAGEDGGPVRLATGTLRDEPFEIAVRVLSLALAEAGGREPPRLGRVEACCTALREAEARGEGLRRTVAGSRVVMEPSGRVTISPEPPRRRGRYPCTGDRAAAAPHSLGKGGGHP